MRRSVVWKVAQVTFLSSLLFLFLGCISEEDGSDCYEVRYLTIKVIDTDTGNDITDSGEVSTADLFIFEPNGAYRNHVRIPKDSIVHRIPVYIKEKSFRGIQISAWGNLGQNEIVSGLYPTCHLEEPQILFKSDGNGWCNSPGDLFLGFREISSSETNGNTEEIILTRKNARMNITVRGLPQGSNASDYYFIISGIKSGYNFKGDLIGSNISMRQTGIFNPGNHDLVTEPSFRLAHTMPGQNLTVSLYRHETGEEGVLLVSGTTDSSGQLIAPVAGKTTNLLIDLTTGSLLRITLVVTPWKEVYQWAIW